MIERETALESFLPRSLLGRAHEKPFRRRVEGLLRLRSWMADASTSSTSSAGTGTGAGSAGLNGSLSRSISGSGSGSGSGVSASEQQAPLSFLGLGERDLLACVSVHVDYFLAEQPNHQLTSHGTSSSTSATTSRQTDGSSKQSQAANANESHAAAILASRVFSEVQVRSSHVRSGVSKCGLVKLFVFVFAQWRLCNESSAAHMFFSIRT